MNKSTEVIQDVSQKNEFLWVKNWSGHIIQQFGTLNSNSHALDFIFFFPELLELSIKSFKLRGKLRCW